MPYIPRGTGEEGPKLESNLYVLAGHPAAVVGRGNRVAYAELVRLPAAYLSDHVG